MKQALHILIAIAFLGSIIAPACGFSWGGKYSVVDICTSEGIESKIVANDENSDDEHQQMVDQCQFCFSHANLSGLVPVSTTIEALVFYGDKIRKNQYESVYLSRQQGDHAARAPPANV